MIRTGLPACRCSNVFKGFYSDITGMSREATHTKGDQKCQKHFPQTGRGPLLTKENTMRGAWKELIPSQLPQEETELPSTTASGLVPQTKPPQWIKFWAAQSRREVGKTRPAGNATQTRNAGKHLCAWMA